MKNMDIPIHSLVRVIWSDSNFSQGWHPASRKTAKVSEIVTIGYVTHVDAETLEVGSTMGLTDGDKLNPLSIPWGCIVECKVFNHKKETTNVKPSVSTPAGDGPRLSLGDFGIARPRDNN